MTLRPVTLGATRVSETTSVCRVKRYGEDQVQARNGPALLVLGLIPFVCVAVVAVGVAVGVAWGRRALSNYPLTPCTTYTLSFASTISRLGCFDLF